MSSPFIPSTAIAASSTLLDRTPTVSNELANWNIPYLDIIPYVGLYPTTPQYEEGCLIDPPVSEPMANKTSLADTVAAEPPDEPPGILSKSHGL